MFYTMRKGLNGSGKCARSSFKLRRHIPATRVITYDLNLFHKLQLHWHHCSFHFNISTPRLHLVLKLEISLIVASLTISQGENICLCPYIKNITILNFKQQS